jgi:hypothetical protein
MKIPVTYYCDESKRYVTGNMVSVIYKSLGGFLADETVAIIQLESGWFEEVKLNKVKAT